MADRWFIAEIRDKRTPNAPIKKQKFHQVNSNLTQSQDEILAEVKANHPEFEYVSFHELAGPSVTKPVDMSQLTHLPGDVHTWPIIKRDSLGNIISMESPKTTAQPQGQAQPAKVSTTESASGLK